MALRPESYPGLRHAQCFTWWRIRDVGVSMLRHITLPAYFSWKCWSGGTTLSKNDWGPSARHATAAINQQSSVVTWQSHDQSQHALETSLINKVVVSSRIACVFGGQGYSRSMQACPAVTSLNSMQVYVGVGVLMGLGFPQEESESFPKSYLLWTSWGLDFGHVC